MFWLALAICCGAAQADPANDRGLSPPASLESFQLRDGCRIELMAAEPLVSDPVSIAFGSDGKLWVVEMGGYPDPPKSSPPQRRPAGRVRYLLDSDGDGRYDQSHVFLVLDPLQTPTSVLPWKQGVLVCAAPEIFYAEDTDQDGRADVRQTILEGFTRGNPQHRVNTLRWGLDNWVHAANGDSGGLIRSDHQPHPRDIHGHDFRFRPTTGQLDLESGMSQFGRCPDDWGNWFGVNSLWAAWHVALEDRYLRRSPWLTPPQPITLICGSSGDAPVFPTSGPAERWNEPDKADRLTSACGIEVYRDDWFGDLMQDSILICEPAHNLVHRRILRRASATFTGERADDEQRGEFLSSSDRWFRPTQVLTGPDGGIWVVDMYRRVIEHPEYILDPAHQDLDWKSGTGQGRIYRILPADRTPRAPQRVDHASWQAMVELLQSPNGTRRDWALQTIVVENQRSAAPALAQLLATHPDPRIRLAALAALDGIESLTHDDLAQAMDDRHHAVRRHAVRLCESRVNDSLKLQAALLKRLQDGNPQVRLQLACSLGEWDDPRAAVALARLASSDGQDPLILAAVLSSVTLYPDVFVNTLLNEQRLTDVQAGIVQKMLRWSIEADHDPIQQRVLHWITTEGPAKNQTQRWTMLAEFLDALAYRAVTLSEYYESSTDQQRAALKTVDVVLEQARQTLADRQADLERRLLATRLVGRERDTNETSWQLLSSLLQPTEPIQLQLAGVQALETLEPEQAARWMLGDWPAHGPELRMAILDTLLRRPIWTAELLAAVESGRLSTREIPVADWNRLILHHDAEIRRRAGLLMRADDNTDRTQVVQRYLPALELAGDAEHGKAIFEKHCLQCHRPHDQGPSLGPDLRTMTNPTAEQLLSAILDPNRTVDPRYLEYVAIDIQGRVFTGLLQHESGTAVTLVGAGGKTWSLLRRDLETLRCTGKSLMPEGLETLISQQDMADLLSYLGQR